MIVGLVHPGEMGAAVGDQLAANGHEVLWASAGRSAETGARATAFRDVETVGSKGTAALLLATREVARHFEVDEALAAEWADSVPGLRERLERAQRAAAKKGWRWAGEMGEIADTFAAAGQPEGFHRAAAEVYRT